LLRLSVDLFPAAVDAKDMRSARDELTEVFAPDAGARISVWVEVRHGAIPVWIYSIALAGTSPNSV
jgi:hypothetical protein